MRPRASWIYVVAGVLGGIFIGFGVVGLSGGISLSATFIAVLGFLVAGWALFDYRRFRRGTPESEVDGGRTIE
jgi:membrane associated rhomboid family serine protease